MTDSYSVECAFGGLGNYQEHETSCMLCPHEVECCHEREIAELEEARRRQASSWRYPRSSGLSRSGTFSSSRSQPAVQPSGRNRSKRPMPVTGEAWAGRLGKNMLASALSAIGYEFGDFWEDHDFAPSVPQLPDRKKEKG